GIRDFHVTGVQTCALPIYKVDRAPDDSFRDLRNRSESDVSVSALTGEGLDRLREAIRRHAFGDRVSGRVRLGPQQSRIRAKLFEIGRASCRERLVSQERVG